MLLDTQNIFSDNQKINTLNTFSQNTVKFGKSDISYLPLLIQVVSDFSDIESLTVKIQTSADESFNSYTELAQATLQKANLTAGAKFPIAHLPEGNLGYIRLAYSSSGTSADTTGAITAGVVAGLDRTISEI